MESATRLKKRKPLFKSVTSLYFCQLFLLLVSSSILCQNAILADFALFWGAFRFWSALFTSGQLF
jgi:hypothetical protein